MAVLDTAPAGISESPGGAPLETGVQLAESAKVAKSGLGCLCRDQAMALLTSSLALDSQAARVKVFAREL